MPGRDRLNSWRFRRRYGFEPPPAWADLTGYEPLLDVIVRERLYELPGDVLEIGALMGGGTAKLCGLLARAAPDKQVVSVDTFDPDFDTTPSPGGFDMAELYSAKIRDLGAGQRDIYDRITARCGNLRVVAGDSARVEIPAETLMFSFIDGHHAAEYVRGDFCRAWPRTAPGGVVAFHDYGGDLRHVTTTIHALIGEYAEAIERVWVDGLIMFVQRQRSS